MSSAALRPEWFRDELYPFSSRFIEIDGSRVHYVDEGEGPTLLMLHGNPTWSFLYRHVITGLRSRFRCVAPDYPGFGLSQPAAGYGFTAAEHSGVVAEFVRRLDLTDYTIMVQDWGGPVGLGAAVREPERVKGLVIGNTWAWPMSDATMRVFSVMMGGLPGHVTSRYLDVFTNVLVPRSRGHSRLTADEMAMYRGPHPTPHSRIPVQTFARQLRAGRPFLASVEAGLPALTDRPALILWPTNDPAFGASVRQRWEQMLSWSRTVPLEGAGHYFQDDVPEQVVNEIVEWFETL